MKKMVIKFITILTLTAGLWIMSAPSLDAQCPMCRMSAESNLKSGGTGPRGLNAGILFMLSLPYLIVGSIGYVWWKSQQSDSDEMAS